MQPMASATKTLTGSPFRMASALSEDCRPDAREALHARAGEELQHKAHAHRASREVGECVV